MVRRYEERGVPAGLIDRLVQNALRAPSAGFAQGWGFLVLDKPASVERFRDAVTPDVDADRWFAAMFAAPVIIVPCANKEIYLDAYARPDKGHGDRSEAWWPAPYWDIDTGFASLLILLTAVDLGLGACFFGIPVDRVDAFRAAFDVPVDYRPIGAISVGYSAERAEDLSAHRRSDQDVIHRQRWGASAAPNSLRHPDV